MKFLFAAVLFLSAGTAIASITPHNLQGFQNTANSAYAVSIASSGTTSSIINTGGMTLVGITLPATFTGTSLTFKSASNGITFQTVKSSTSGTSLTYTVAQGTYVAIDPKDFYGVQYLELVSGSTETGARSFSVSLKGL